jgi:hypothetical protein
VKITSSITVTPEIRQLIVRQLGAALAAAWRQRQHDASNEKAQKPRVTASGRGDVRGDGGRELHDSNTIAT